MVKQGRVSRSESFPDDGHEKRIIGNLAFFRPHVANDLPGSHDSLRFENNAGTDNLRYRVESLKETVGAG